MNFPDIVLLDNANFCNLKCSMCDHGNVRKYRKLQTMDRALYEKLIDEIAAKNPSARVWEIFFGDPFLCKDMAARIRYAKDKGLTDVVVNTNGVLMTAAKARAFIEAGLDAIYVGVDAATPETYAKLRVGGDFDKVVRNVLGYRDLLEKIGRRGQKLFAQLVVTEHNEGEVQAFTSFWKRAGVGVKLRPKISWAGLVDAKNLRPNEDVERKPCYWLTKTINVCADGRVALCAADIHCRVENGDVRARSIESIWNGELKRWRDLQRAGRFEELPGICRGCRDWQSAYAEYA